MNRRGLWVAGAALIAAVLAGAGIWAADGYSPAGSELAPLGDRSRCAAYSGLPQAWGEDRHAGMARIAGGDFGLGSQRGYGEERPVVRAHIAGFWIDRTEVTNAQFQSFVQATGYITEAERHPSAAVFRVDPNSALTPGSWWHLVEGADWRHPQGPGSDIAGRGHEPVVDVTYADAQAYARWLGHRLPDEAQWEYAAKAGRGDAEADRALRDAQGRPQANFWQGAFPLQDRGEDGFTGLAPVGCYAANPNGLQDMVGNVWEWTSDIYQDHHGGGLAESQTVMPVRSGAPRRVIKGGSYLCSLDYCARARASSRQAEEFDLPAAHLGFRTISD